MLLPPTVSAPAAVRALSVQVAYRGAGWDHTVYRSTPPNPGGGPDHDHADDRGTQRWSLRFDQTLTLGPPARTTLRGASGNVVLTGSIDHVHRDGLYRQLDAAAHCTVRYASPADVEPEAQLEVTLTSSSIIMQAVDPIFGALLLLPQTCPGQGDSIDGLADNYFMPGYSPFVAGYGTHAWFRSGRATVSRRTLTRTGRATVKLSLTAAGRPPRNCDRDGPAYASCSFSGAWTGRVIFTVRRDTTRP